MPSGPMIGEAMTARVPRPWRRRALDDPLEDLAVDRRVAHDAVVGAALAGLELRLDQRDDRRRAGASVGATGPRTRSSEMNETSIVARSIGSGSVAAVSVAGVRPLHRDDARVAPERFGELAATHVESVDARRAALQQDVGEAAGRGTDVEARPSRRVDLERVERRRELVAAAADVRLAAPSTATVVAASIRSPGLRSRRAASPSPTRTLPASTSACARLRVSARPRSTSSWSSRTRGAWRS